jgi:hypothetical protein
MQKLGRTSAPVFAVLLCLSCGGGDAPEDVYRRFLTAVALGDAEGAAREIDEESLRALLVAVRRENERAPDILEPSDLGARLRGVNDAVEAVRRLWSLDAEGEAPAATPEFVRRITVLATSIEGDRASLKVATPGGVRTVALRRTSGVWKIELAGLEPVSGK